MLLPINPHHPEPAIIEQAADLIRHGRLVAFPTETVYGLGADALNETAVRRIFTAKGRPAYDPIIVHIASTAELPLIAHNPPALAYTLAEAFWPGPLTLVLAKTAAVPPAITAGGPTVAVRCPAHPVALALIRAAGTPIGAPSANRFSHTSPTTAQHVWADLAGQVDLVLDGGPTQVGVESTVLDLTTAIPTLLRPGGVSLEALTAVLGPIALATREMGEHTAEALPSPGMLERHYAPRTPLHLITGNDMANLGQALATAAQTAHASDQRVALLLAAEDVPSVVELGFPYVVVGSLADLDEVAQNLFRALRELDSADPTLILARDFPAHGLGRAIRDRLRRAAVQVVGEE
ncbi:MAG: L-threonylcarbamoyladenylate synthase [Chloroflexi bacterium]|nr:L-threonylcarbamoyladenylate synthase [Chloroflexota bacterium]